MSNNNPNKNKRVATPGKTALTKSKCISAPAKATLISLAGFAGYCCFQHMYPVEKDDDVTDCKKPKHKKHKKRKKKCCCLGTQGTQGFQGYQGNQGFQGNQGVGFQGFQGIVGFQSAGLQGNQGIVGLFVFFGSQGFQGYQGLQGIGFQGNQGLEGQFISTGFQGLQGFQGLGFQGSNITEDFAFMSSGADLVPALSTTFIGQGSVSTDVGTSTQVVPRNMTVTNLTASYFGNNINTAPVTFTLAKYPGPNYVTNIAVENVVVPPSGLFGNTNSKVVNVPFNAGDLFTCVVTGNNVDINANFTIRYI